MAALLILLVTMFIFAVLRGCSLDVFWDWFISGPGAPFHGSAPNLTFAQALGVSLVVSFLTLNVTSDHDEDKDAVELILIGFAKGIVLYTFFWIFALIYHGLMS